MNMLKDLAVKHLVGSRKGDKPGLRGHAHLSYLSPSTRMMGLVRRHDHPNRIEHRIILEELLARFQKVTLTDYRHDGEGINPDFVFGFGPGLKHAVAAGTPFVYYATGCANLRQMRLVEQEIAFVKALGIPLAIEEFRIPDGFYGTSEASARSIYTIGSEWTQQTFDHRGTRVVRLPGIPLGLEDRSFQAVLRNRQPGADNLLWIGSKGVLHKGLHLALEVSRLLGKPLVAVGVSPASFPYVTRLVKHFGTNCEIHGNLQVGNEPWNRILARSALAIGCSVSEGMSTSLLTAALFGAYPVSTATCGLEVGDIVAPASLDERAEVLAAAVEAHLSLPDAVRLEKSLSISERVQVENAPEAYRRLLAGYLDSDLADSSRLGA